MVGFQGSETSRIEATIYTHRGTTFVYDTRVVGGRGFSGIVEMQYDHAFGSASAAFSLVIKSSEDLIYELEDDDWVDVVARRHDQTFHLARAVISGISRSTRVINDATVRVFVLQCRSFGVIFERTPLWFDRVTRNNWGPAAASRIWNEHHDFANGTPAVLTSTLLAGFLQPANNQGAGYWRLPDGLPNARGSFIENIQFNTSGYSNVPSRGGAQTPLSMTYDSSSVWALANEWADLPLCEFYTDLVPAYDMFNGAAASDPTTTRMAVIFRDRPFPNTVRDTQLSAAPYFSKIPLYTVPIQQVSELGVSRSGASRVNTFFFAPMLLQRLARGYIDMQVPLSNTADVALHGMRRMDAVSRYLADGSTDVYVTMARGYRQILRDIHCLNHRYLSGRITLTLGRPDIRIGGRLRIQRDADEDAETYYVEGVSHRWSFETGLRTSCTVTRGWRGTDASLVEALNDTIAQYTTQDYATPAAPAPANAAPVAPPVQRSVATEPTAGEAALPSTAYIDELQRQPNGPLSPYPNSTYDGRNPPGPTLRSGQMYDADTNSVTTPRGQDRTPR